MPHRRLVPLTETHVGFTGTRKGMTRDQKRRLLLLFEEITNKSRHVVFHHGDCVGADAEAHHLARKFPFKIVGHPPINDKFRAFCDFDEVREEKDYLDRNRDIVDESMYVIGAPAEPEQQLRSGTWSTIRYAEKCGKLWVIVRPQLGGVAELADAPDLGSGGENRGGSSPPAPTNM